MNPSLFDVHGDQVVEVLGMIVLLAIVLERALSLVYESRFYVEHFQKKGYKEILAFLVSVSVAYYYKFDALAVFFGHEAQSYVGYLITGAVIAGGSKGSIKLFRDFFGWKSSVQKEVEAQRQAKSGSA